MKNMTSGLVMKNGTPYEIHLCVERETGHTPEFLKGQIVNAMHGMSSWSRWLRFASPARKLSGKQLDYLTTLN